VQCDIPMTCRVPVCTADKHARMKAVFAYYNNGDLHALDSFPGGSEKGT